MQFVFRMAWYHAQLRQPIYMHNITATLTADSKIWSCHGTRANEHMTETVEQRTR